MKMVYTNNVPKEMILKEPNKEGLYEWKLMKGTMTYEQYEEIENMYNVKLPENFINWHKAYFFEDGDCSIIRLPSSNPNKPLFKVAENLNWFIAEELIPQGLIPFADEGNDAGPLVFDTRNQNQRIDYPIRVYDQEYQGHLDGLTDVIFSSFSKLIECITYFLHQSATKKSFEIYPEFFKIDPEGAGKTGKEYWTQWINMDKGNYEMFGE